MEIANKVPQCDAPPPSAGLELESGGIGNLEASSCSRSRSGVDETRLAQLVDAAERYRPQLLWIATRITNRREEAEDIVQQALLKAYVNLCKFRGESQMSTWLRAIVRIPPASTCEISEEERSSRLSAHRSMTGPAMTSTFRIPP